MSQQINLLNPQLFTRKDWLNGYSLLGLSGAAILMMAGLFAWSDYHAQQLAHEHQALTAELSVVKSRVDVAMQAHAPKPPSKALEEELTRAEATLQSRRQIITFLEGDGIGSHDGFSGYLEAFARQNLTGIWLSGFTLAEAAHHISIEGKALQPELVPRYIAALGQEPLLNGRQFSALEMETPGAAADRNATGKPQGAAPASVVSFKLQSVDDVKASAATAGGQQ